VAAPRATAPEEVSLNESAEEPVNLAFSAQLASPGRDLPVIGLLLPVPAAAAAALRNPVLAATNLFGASLASAVDLEQPFDVAMPIQAGEPNSFAFGITLKNDEAERASLRDDFRWIAREGGRSGLTPLHEGSAGMIGKMFSCDLWPAWREGAPRLVCATEPSLVQSYGRFLARGVTRRAPTASLQAHFTIAGLRSSMHDTYDALDRAAPASVTAGRKMGRRWAERYFDDLTAIDVELTLGAGHVEVALDQTFRSLTSMMTLVQRATANAPQPLPQAFWRLPGDADVAFFLQGTPPDVMKPAGAELLGDALAAIPESELPASARGEVERAMAALFFTGGPLLVAHGHDRAAAEKALGGLAAIPDKSGKKAVAALEKAQKEARSSLQGWTLIHLDEPPSLWRDGLRELRRVAAKDYSIEAAGDSAPAKRSSPGAKNKKKKSSERANRAVREVALGPGDALPAGSLHLLNHTWANPDYVPSKGDEAAPILERDLHLFMVPDGEGTWLCIAEDEALARAKLGQVMAPAAPDARADLASLRSARGAGVGFVTLAGLVSLFIPDDSREGMGVARQVLQGASALASGGRTPVPLLWTSTDTPRPKGGPLHHVRLSMDLDADALQDAIQWLAKQANGGVQ
jgi:hypothetical protein